MLPKASDYWPAERKQSTVMILFIGTEISVLQVNSAVQDPIAPGEQTDQDLHCLFSIHHLPLTYQRIRHSNATWSNFKIITVNG